MHLLDKFRFLVGLWVVTIWIGGFLFNSVEQFNKCFIFCCKLSIAMTKFELFWCMCVLAPKRLAKKENLCMEKKWLEIDQNQVGPTLCFCNFFFVETKPMSFCPMLYNLCAIMSTLSFDGVCTLVNFSLLTHSSWFSSMGCSFSWGCCNSRGSGKWWFLLQ